MFLSSSLFSSFFVNRRPVKSKNGHFTRTRKNNFQDLTRETREKRRRRRRQRRRRKNRKGAKRARKKSNSEVFLPLLVLRVARWRRCCGIWSWSATIFVWLIFYRDWIKLISNSCTRWIVRRESWWRDHLARVIWKRRLKLKRCRRYRLWSLRGRINRRGRVTGGKHGSALELL